MEKRKRNQDHIERLLLKDNSNARILFGEYNANLKLLERSLEIKIDTRGNELIISGGPEEVALANASLTEMYHLIEEGYPLHPNDVELAVRVLRGDKKTRLKDIFQERIPVPSKKRVIVPKTLNQKHYVDAVRRADLVFGIGPAGTGKTYLAMAMAVSALTRGDVNRIVLARPAVEAGEKLGFLPGDLYEKVDPYLRPLYDALHDMMDFDRASKSIQKGTIEVAPLAYMRGRTLNDSFVILDEAQNSTTEQMKMFLTRLGFGSKAVVTGDITQIDLPSGVTSGLVEARDILSNIKGIEIVYFTREDVIRHPLVQEIIEAYENLDQRRSERKRNGKTQAN